MGSSSGRFQRDLYRIRSAVMKHCLRETGSDFNHVCVHQIVGPVQPSDRQPPLDHIPVPIHLTSAASLSLLSDSSAFHAF